MKKISLFVLGLTLVAMLMACSSGDDPAPTATSPPSAVPTISPVAVPADAEGAASTDEPGEVQVVEVTMHMTGYNPSEVRVKAGSQVRFDLTNVDSEEHDLYNRQAKIDIGLSPGEAVTYDWMAPDQAGTYVAECSFHEGLLMTIVVEE